MVFQKGHAGSYSNFKPMDGDAAQDLKKIKKLVKQEPVEASAVEAAMMSALDENAEKTAAEKVRLAGMAAIASIVSSSQVKKTKKDKKDKKDKKRTRASDEDDNLLIKRLRADAEIHNDRLELALADRVAEIFKENLKKQIDEMIADAKDEIDDMIADVKCEHPTLDIDRKFVLLWEKCKATFERKDDD